MLLCVWWCVVWCVVCVCGGGGVWWCGGDGVCCVVDCVCIIPYTYMYIEQKKFSLCE